MNNENTIYNIYTRSNKPKLDIISYLTDTVILKKNRLSKIISELILIIAIGYIT